MTPSPVYVGVDVSKRTLDVFVPGLGHRQFSNTPAGVKKVLGWVSALPAVVLCCEASGGFEHALLETCFAQQVPVALVMANRVRQWARSQGKLAKTDRLDAQAIASFAAASQPRLRIPTSPHRKRLRDLVRRRDWEVRHCAALRTRLQQEQQPDLKQMTRTQIRRAQRDIQALEQKIQQVLDSAAPLGHLAQRLQKAKGIGPVTAATAIAERPALGSLGGQSVAALSGLAPFNYDSGPYRGRRRTWGGNPRLRRAFFQASLSASQHNAVLRRFYRRLRDRGKDQKVARIAVARKLCRLVERIAADPAFEPA